MPGIYPMNVVAKVECYVCGFVAETKAMPNTCPNCGAARYAFEKEISLSKAWEIAAEAGRKSATLFGESAAHTAGRAKAVLEELARDEEGQAVQADRQLAELPTRTVGSNAAPREDAPPSGRDPSLHDLRLLWPRLPCPS